MKIGFIGLGKLGLPVALAINSKGHDVIGTDIDDKIEKYIINKKIPYKELYVDELFKKSTLKFANFKTVIEKSDIIFVAIQTPHEKLFEGISRLPKKRKDFEYNYLINALKQISDYVDSLNEEKIVIIISTVLPGSIEKYIKPILSSKIKLCYNPFFIAMGTTVKDFLNPEFVLLGVEDPKISNIVKSFYSTIHNKTIYETTIKNAELIKVCYNTFIGMKIVFANTLMEICHKTGCNVDGVIKAISLANERLISSKYLNGGMGDGGGCHPRDNIAMSWLSRQLNLSHDFFEDLMIARENQTEWLAELCLKTNKKNICILGKSFKPESNIETGSPSILLFNILKEKTDKIYIIDPVIDGEINFKKYFDTFDNDTVFFIGTKHSFFEKLKFPDKSTVIDPFRFLKKCGDYDLIKIGE